MPCGSSKELYQDKNGESSHCPFQDLDHAVLQEPLNLGVTNLKQVLKCVQSGSKEVKDLVLNECNIIYECKVCANLFRSLANFLYHKRCYCKKHICESMVLFENFEENSIPTATKAKSPQKVKSSSETMPKIKECTVELIKTDLVEVKGDVLSNGIKSLSKPASSAKEKVNGKDSKKEQVDNVEKKNSKVANPMMSRRTREKTTASKIVIKNLDEPPKKVVKVSKANDESAKTAPKKLSVKSNKEVTAISVDSEEKNNAKDKATTSKNVSEKNTGSTNDIANPSSKIFVKPTKKIIFAKPRSVDPKNSATVLNNIKKNMTADKIGFTGITNIGKNLQVFPKIIFKAIDGNPHAVFQSTGNAKPDEIDNRKPVKADKDQLVIVLKKEEKNKPENLKFSEPEKPTKVIKKSQNEFHLTRRKKLLARTDCNVPDLKCLICNASFTSLKTLYFHMLAIHSKKRQYFPCPFCKAYFVQMYGVTRHLISIHKKTKEQINKLRDVIKKKCVWKKVELFKEETKEIDIAVKGEKLPEINSTLLEMHADKEEEVDSLPLKFMGKNDEIHKCSKCNRVFGRKSSQVSHEKFCIMNAIKIETTDGGVISPLSPPPTVSFLSPIPKVVPTDQPVNRQIQTPTSTTLTNIKISQRPKRGAEKQMHKDFVNSQTLKWRSVNKVDQTTKNIVTEKKTLGKALEKKVFSIMNVENLACQKCDKTFSSYSNLRRHAAIHVGWTRFKCKFCEYQAYNKSQCFSHLQKAHGVLDNELEKATVKIGQGKRKPKCATKIGAARLFGIKKPSETKSSLSKMKLPQKSANNIGTKSSSYKRNPHVIRKLDFESKKAKNENKKEMECKKPHEIHEKNKIHEKSKILDHKKENSSVKKEKNNVVLSFCKSNVLDGKKDASNYKSVTTNNPTTIILSKKITSLPAQSITISPESSTSSPEKTSSIRTSPRKNETKILDGSLVTRSGSYSKTNPIQIKLTAESDEYVKNNSNLQNSSEKVNAKKDKLISEWFPKKNLNCNSARRESAPLIIGLVPASGSGINVRSKNPAITYESDS